MDDDILNDADHFHTADLALAAVLSLSYPMEAVDYGDPHAVRFVFQRHSGIDELIEQYHYGDLQVEPLPYYQLIRHLQAQLSGDLA